MTEGLIDTNANTSNDVEGYLRASYPNVEETSNGRSDYWRKYRGVILWT